MKRQEDPVKKAERMVAWRAKNAEAIRSYDAERRCNPAVMERERAAKALYRAENKAAIAIYNADYAARNVECIAARRAERSQARAKYNKAWRKANAARCLAIVRKRQAALLMATPPWFDSAMQNDVIALYETARQMTRQTGIQHHVDHVVPLRGKSVCGLHVPWNLQVLTATENLKKGTKFPESAELPRIKTTSTVTEG